ncbi:MAG: anti-sigma F factor [Oscillospiraceae bacterium]|jgi:stage II sporulation protein AB (anti-sigma F factor)|nr:anti-sigma F factor [Oscillospiraceae bacterium]
MNIRKNHMRLCFDSKSANESFARVAVSAFMSQLSPTLEEINDVKTAVSEAVTNAIVHGYKDESGEVVIDASLWDDGRVIIDVSDTGCGIDDISQAMTPFFTSQPEMERAGMGFAVMQTFMDDVRVTSRPGQGTSVFMVKRVKGSAK